MTFRTTDTGTSNVTHGTCAESARPARHARLRRNNRAIAHRNIGCRVTGLGF